MKFGSEWQMTLVIASMGMATSTRAEPAAFMQPISGTTRTTAVETATRNILALNTAMFELYGQAGEVIQGNILANHPVILAMFSSAGGRLLLYRPGQSVLEAPSVPIVYQLMKSVGHSTMALAEVVTPYLDNAPNQSWRAPLLAYRSRMQSALDSLDATPMPDEWRVTSRHILAGNIAFMDASVRKGMISTADLQSFADAQAPGLKQVVAWAAQTQVGHWMGVVAGWKAMLGADWDKTYAASNTIYVTRQNNILFSVLAQYFGRNALNSRLLLIETISFTSTPEDMLGSLTRIIADRSVGALFFKNYYMMDYELMGGDGRAVIVAEDAKRGITPFLPPKVPFFSHEWPMRITPGPGATSLADLH